METTPETCAMSEPMKAEQRPPAGKPVLSLVPDQFHQIDTRVGFAFVVVDGGGNCIDVVQTKKTDNSFEFPEPRQCAKWSEPRVSRIECFQMGFQRLCCKAK